MQKSLIFSGLMAFTVTLFVFASPNIFDHITETFKKGSATELSKFFNSNVDLTIDNKEEVYSKIQAEQVLKDFFSKNPPKSFTLIHQGVSKEGAKYAIGNLITTQGHSFRIYLYIKPSKGSEYIQELRIEKQ